MYSLYFFTITVTVTVRNGTVRNGTERNERSRSRAKNETFTVRVFREFEKITVLKSVKSQKTLILFTFFIEDFNRLIKIGFPLLIILY